MVTAIVIPPMIRIPVNQNSTIPPQKKQIPLSPLKFTIVSHDDKNSSWLTPRGPFHSTTLELQTKVLSVIDPTPETEPARIFTAFPGNRSRCEAETTI